MTWLDSGHRVDTLVVEGANILDLDIVVEEEPALSSSLTEPFVDPAIVSYDRPGNTNRSTPTPVPQTEFRPSPPTDNSSAAIGSNAARTTPATHSQPAIPLKTKPKEGVIQHTFLQETVALATLAAPFDDLSLQDRVDIRHGHAAYVNTPPAALPRDVASSLAENIQPSPKPVGRRNRRGPQKGKAPINEREVLGKEQPQSVQLDPARGSNEPKRTKGWRQTPLTVAASHPDHHPRNGPPQPDVSGNKRKSRKNLAVREDQNGWATGEASDIQDMGDFDFEGNLSKFDKHKIFEKIRQGDTTAEEERLVSFNRSHARPGTNGGKNLHYSENVLDSPKDNERLAWNKADSEDEISEAKFSSGRSSRRNISRISSRKAPSRKGSAIQSGDQYLAGSAPLSDQIAKARYSSNDQAGSPIASNPSVATLSTVKPSLRILPSNRTCPYLTPLQMVELELLATSELGLTEDMLTENAARGIAETARKLVNVQPGHSSTNDLAPLIFIMAGNHRSGARAIAAGRHLRNHHTRVVVCVLGLEREEHFIDSVRRQLVIYRNCGGLTSKPDELIQTLQHLQAPRSFIIDALLGIHTSFDDLRTDDQIAYSQLSKWANNTDFSTISIDIPSGLDASSSKFHFTYFQKISMTNVFLDFQKGIPSDAATTSLAEMDLVIQADFILSLGAPKVGLVTALLKSDKKWKLFLADIGICNSTWKKFGISRRMEGVEFGGEWVVGLGFGV